MWIKISIIWCPSVCRCCMAKWRRLNSVCNLCIGNGSHFTPNWSQHSSWHLRVRIFHSYNIIQVPYYVLYWGDCMNRMVEVRKWRSTITFSTARITIEWVSSGLKWMSRNGVHFLYTYNLLRPEWHIVEQIIMTHVVPWDHDVQDISWKVN